MHIYLVKITTTSLDVHTTYLNTVICAKRDCACLEGTIDRIYLIHLENYKNNNKLVEINFRVKT